MSRKNSYDNMVSKTNDELKMDLFELKKSLFNLRFRVAAKDVVDVSQFKKSRRAIARIQTERSRRITEGGQDA
jgi:ribosomal protein L29